LIGLLRVKMEAASGRAPLFVLGLAAFDESAVGHLLGRVEGFRRVVFLLLR
jgi:hypothetical protein